MSVLVFLMVGENGLGSGGNAGVLKNFVKSFQLGGVEIGVGRGVSVINKVRQILSFQCHLDVFLVTKPIGFITKFLEF